MYTKQPKKMLIMNILDILKKYTDENHRLSQKEIQERLKSEYDMVVDRKAIRRNIMNLMECGYQIEYKETVRGDSYIWSDFYLEHTFTDGELRLLIDGLLFSKHIPYSQCEELVEKLDGLSNVYFRSRIKHIATLSERFSDNNKELFLNIEMLDEAIERGKKVRFEYVEYGMDKQIHTKTNPDGSPKLYVITPYQMVAKEGKYYLICNYDKYDAVSNYRVDRIRNIQILDEPGKPFSSLSEAHNQRLNLAEYMKEHIYMYAGETVSVKFRIVKVMISDVIDMFGQDVAFSEETDTHVTVAVRANETAMAQFAKNYGPDVVVLHPPKLKERIREELEKALQVYEE